MMRSRWAPVVGSGSTIRPPFGSCPSDAMARSRSAAAFPTGVGTSSIASDAAAASAARWKLLEGGCFRVTYEGNARQGRCDLPVHLVPLAGDCRLADEHARKINTLARQTSDKTRANQNGAIEVKDQYCTRFS